MVSCTRLGGSVLPIKRAEFTIRIVNQPISLCSGADVVFELQDYHIDDNCYAGSANKTSSRGMVPGGTGFPGDARPSIAVARARCGEETRCSNKR